MKDNLTGKFTIESYSILNVEIHSPLGNGSCTLTFKPNRDFSLNSFKEVIKFYDENLDINALGSDYTLRPTYKQDGTIIIKGLHFYNYQNKSDSTKIDMGLFWDNFFTIQHDNNYEPIQFKYSFKSWYERVKLQLT